MSSASHTESGAARRLGVVTIGQSPRVDMVPEMVGWLGDVEVAERGALDDHTNAQVAALAPPAAGPPGDEGVLVTRLRDGTSAVMAHRHVVPRVQSAIDHLETLGVAATLLVCTGEFPPLRHDRPLLTAEQLLLHGVAGIRGGDDRPLGVVCPLPEQVAMSQAKWGRFGGVVEVAAASPYTGDAATAVAEAAGRLARRGAGWVVLDCMGYTQAMRVAARRTAGVPVLLARAVVARLAAEAVA